MSHSQTEPKPAHWKLAVPMYWMFYIDGLSGDPVPDGGFKKLYGTNSKDYIIDLIDDLEWAKRNPDYPFVSFLPPVAELGYTDKDVYQFLCYVLEKMKKTLPTRLS